MRSWIIGLPRPDLLHCIKISSFGSERNHNGISEVQEGDGVACYALREGRIIALGTVTRSYYQDQTPQFLKEGIFAHRFDFRGHLLGDGELSVPELGHLTSVPNGGNFGLVVKSGFHSLTDRDWNLFCQRTGLLQLLNPEPADAEEAPPEENTDSNADEAGATRRYWWVNQGQTYKQERQGGYIWAPQKGKNGQPFYHHVNVSKVRKNDVIWHYVDGQIVAVSMALENAQESPKPAELKTDAWSTEGYFVKVQYVDLMQPIKLASIPIDIRTRLSTKGKTPFRSDGAVNQGYLFGITKEFATKLAATYPVLNTFGEAEQPDLITAPVLNDTKNVSPVTLFIDAIDKLRLDRDKSSEPRLYKPALMLAVIDLIDRQELLENRVIFDSIISSFGKTLNKYGKSGGEKQAAAAFFHMQNEPFWNLTLNGTVAPQAGEPAQIRRNVEYASFLEPYWSVLIDDVTREKVKEAITSRWFANLEEVVDEITDFDLGRETKNLIDAIGRTGFKFEPWQVACYVAALKTKPFLILAGVSGSGKSQLPQLVAKATGTISHLVPVRPDWTDSSEILGYVQLQGKLSVGKLLKIADDANSNLHRRYLCIIDEMNLARVEHYFAEILSRIEQSRADTDGQEPLLNYALSADDKRFEKVYLSSNIGLVGTVNMDESTHGFSKKVLDRAFTLEFSEIDLRDWEKHETDTKSDIKSQKSWPASAWLPRATSLAMLENISEVDRAHINKVIDVLITVNEILGQAQLQLAYRSRDEIALFVLHASELTDLFVSQSGAKVDPLDLALQMKVLPRIAGGSGAIRKVVLELLGWSWKGGIFKSEEDAKDVTAEWSKNRKPHYLDDANYPRTCARLCLMWDRIQNEGYTSFWL
jgi:hypothetical protein